jgi:phosphatidylserine/phosphatidylglycerophosphate/cardiolipin synthase-like enzyme
MVASAAGCNVDGPELREQITPRVQPFFNAPGTRESNDRNRLSSEFVVQQFDEAEVSLDLCIYGLSKQNIIDAAIRAHKRGVKVRVVGDARHLQYKGPGYSAFAEHQIPMQVGNQFHIMHNKFFIVDGRFVFVGTGNITTTGFGRNNNNWLYIDSVPVAQDFLAEFNQMFSGKFSSAKDEIDNGEKYQVGDTVVEVYFSPQEDTMGVILEELELVDTSIHFQIFAFTKDQVGSAFITKHREFMRKNNAAAAAGEIPADWQDQPPVDWPKKVVGILDRSQLHGNGQYHEGYRLTAFGVPMRLEGNENSRLPGDYQAGGGRLHTKTMILDAGTPNARVITGSFNWSSSATISNDEVLLVLRGERITEAYMDVYREMWKQSRSIDGGMCYYLAPADLDPDQPKPACSDEVGPGDVIFSEIHWDGWNGQEDISDHTADRTDVSNDEFIELYNPTDQTINLSMWTITNGEDFKVGLTPGTVIGPGEYFLILDHNSAPYANGDPQRGQQAFLNPDFVMNMANDPRFLSLRIKNVDQYLDIRDATGEVIDRAGNSGTPLAGGRKKVGMVGDTDGDGVADTDVDGDGDTDGDLDHDNYPDPIVHNFSMERIIAEDGSVGDGAELSSWKSCSLEEGGQNVAPEYREFIIATPGEPNSP